MTGLVLAGGGGKGAYQIGVWKSLRELGIEITAVTGTSVGALNGAFIVQDKYEEALELWENMSPEMVMETDGEFFNDFINFRLKFNLENLDTYLKLADKHLKEKGISVKPLRDLIEKNVDEEAMRASVIDFGLVTISLSDRKPMELFLEEIPEGKIDEYLMASASLPAFESMELDGGFFLDGGFYDNLPINLMLKKGVDQIIAVDLKAIGVKQSVKTHDVSITYITPSGPLGMVLEFDAEKSKRNILMGYLDTLKVFEQVKGNKYFLTHLPSEDDILEHLIECDSERIQELFTAMKIKEQPTKRNLLEKAIPAIAKLHGLESQHGYTEIIIAVVEEIAEKLLLERLKVYRYDEIVNLILDREIAEPFEFDLKRLGESIKALKSSIKKQSAKFQLSVRLLELIDNLDEKKTQK
jgi:NTE family protein